jgi:hypothetical protein
MGRGNLDPVEASVRLRRDRKAGRGMVEVGCWAHARRHVHQALETDPSRMRRINAGVAELADIHICDDFAVDSARRCYHKVRMEEKQ